MKGSFTAAALVLVATVMAVASGLEVHKSVASYPELENAFTVTLEYTLPLGEDETAETAKHRDITIRDSAPEEFVLVQGALVKRVKSVTPGETQKFEYVIRLADDVAFTLKNTTRYINLPKAYFEVFSDDTDAAEVVENTQTDIVAVPVKLHTPSPIFVIPEIPYMGLIVVAAIFVFPITSALLCTKISSVSKAKTN